VCWPSSGGARRYWTGVPESRSGLATSGNADLVGPLMNDPYVIAGVSDGGCIFIQIPMPAAGLPLSVKTWL